MLWASLKTRMSFIAPLKSISDPCRTVKRIEKIVISVELKYYFAAKIRDHDLTRQSLKNTEMEFWHPEEKWSFGSPTKYVRQPKIKTFQQHCIYSLMFTRNYVTVDQQLNFDKSLFTSWCEVHRRRRGNFIFRKIQADFFYSCAGFIVNQIIFSRLEAQAQWWESSTYSDQVAILRFLFLLLALLSSQFSTFYHFSSTPSSGRKPFNSIIRIIHNCVMFLGFIAPSKRTCDSPRQSSFCVKESAVDKTLKRTL